MAYNKKAVLQANTDAIRTVLRLEKERREATDIEKEKLRGYQGFGGLKCVLNQTDSKADIAYWAKSEQDLFAPTQGLKQLIYREALDATTAKRYWDSIRASVLTSFYTDERIVGAIAEGINSSGVRIDKVLDPSMGMGAFTDAFQSQASFIQGYEKDLLTASIQKALNSDKASKLHIEQAPFESIGELKDEERFDLITSNIPFGDFMVYDRSYTKSKDAVKQSSTRAIHNYFFVKGLDTIKEGGLLAFITSRGLLDSPKNEPIRRYLMEHSDLVSAIRLPDGMFSSNAGTEVGSDLLILQKHSDKTALGLNPNEESFINTLLTGDSITINQLFEEPNQKYIGQRSVGTNAYGKPAYVYEHKDMDFIAGELKELISLDFEENFDKGLYQTGKATIKADKTDKAEDSVIEELMEEESIDDDAYNLMPIKIECQIPKLYKQENTAKHNQIAYVRYFHPLSTYTAYFLEYNPKEQLAFGIAAVDGKSWEYGYFSLQELEEVNIMGLRMERDISFDRGGEHNGLKNGT